MLCDVTNLRLRGVRLKRAELGLPVRGFLSMREDHETSFHRTVTVARLVIPALGIGMQTSVMIPIFDVKVIRIEAGYMTLMGVELDHEHRGDSIRIIEHVQIWRCRPVLDESKPPVREFTAEARDAPRREVVGRTEVLKKLLKPPPADPPDDSLELA